MVEEVDEVADPGGLGVGARVPRGRVRKIEHDAAEMMAFVVSGGVSGKRLPPA